MATGWPGIAVSLKIKYKRISSIHLHILMDLALGGHGGIVLWKDKWQIQEIQTNLKLFKIWGELISSAWLKQVCVKALVVADYSQPSGHAVRQGFMFWVQGCTNITISLGHRLIHLLSFAVSYELTCWGFVAWGVTLPFPLPWYRDVLEDAAFVILRSQLSLKIFLSLPGPQPVSCSELGAKCHWASTTLIESMCTMGAQCLSRPYVEYKAWENNFIGHEKWCSFAFKTAKLSFCCLFCLMLVSIPWVSLLLVTTKLFHALYANAPCEVALSFSGW